MIRKTKGLKLSRGQYAYTAPHRDDFSRFFYLAAILNSELAFGSVKELVIYREEPLDYKYALKFNGVSSYVRVELLGACYYLSGIVIKLWYKPDGFGHDMCLVATGGSEGAFMRLVEGKRLQGGIANVPIVEVEPEDELNDTNHWYHLVYAIDYDYLIGGQKHMLFIDGLKRKEVITSYTSVVIVDPFYIGGKPNNEEVCNGSIDEFGMYSWWPSYKLDEDYNNGVGRRGEPEDSWYWNLFLGYHFDEGNGNVAYAYDRSLSASAWLEPSGSEPEWVEGHVPFKPIPWGIAEDRDFGGTGYITFISNSETAGGFGTLWNKKYFIEIALDFQRNFGLATINGLTASNLGATIFDESESGFIKIGGNKWEGSIELLVIDNKMPSWFYTNVVSGNKFYWADGTVPILIYPENTEQFLHFYDFNEVSNGIVPDLGSSPQPLTLVDATLVDGETGYMAGVPYIAHEGIQVRIK